MFSKTFGYSSNTFRKRNNTKLYKNLELTPRATDAEIRKAYIRLAVRHHPDKGGDKDTFIGISNAYQILGNPEKKIIYDEKGDSLDSSPDIDSGSSTDNIFNFGAEHKSGSSSDESFEDVLPKRRGENIEKTLEITLNEAYTGKIFKYPIERHVQCKACKGKGGFVFKTCKRCSGSGQIQEICYNGLLLQYVFRPCTSCINGQVLIGGRECMSCKGAGVQTERIHLDVFVEPGVTDNHTYLFSGEADSYPRTFPGDVIITIKIKKHKDFVRKGAHLLTKRFINLYEALCGFELEFQHLDGRNLLVISHPQEILEHEAVRVIENEGMPIIQGSKHKSSHLFIVFNILMPKFNELKLHGDALKTLLKQILPKKLGPKQSSSKIQEVVTLKTLNPEIHIPKQDNLLHELKFATKDFF